jgi:predicted RNA-binding protein (virulence factor B family)
LPNRRQSGPIIEDALVVVRVVQDFEEQGIVADTDLEIYFNRDTSKLKEDQEVDLLVYGSTALGLMVIVENEYPGLVYRSEVFTEPETGDKLTGWISKIREDGKLDISLKRKGYYAVIDSSDSLLQLIKENQGFIPLHDKSSPEDIKEKLGMSKKLFKKIAGGLYRDGLITIEETGLQLVKKENESGV